MKDHELYWFLVKGFCWHFYCVSFNFISSHKIRWNHLRAGGWRLIGMKWWRCLLNNLAARSCYVSACLIVFCCASSTRSLIAVTIWRLFFHLNEWIALKYPPYSFWCDVWVVLEGKKKPREMLNNEGKNCIQQFDWGQSMSKAWRMIVDLRFWLPYAEEVDLTVTCVHSNGLWEFFQHFSFSPSSSQHVLFVKYVRLNGKQFNWFPSPNFTLTVISWCIISIYKTENCQKVQQDRSTCFTESHAPSTPIVDAWGGGWRRWKREKYKFYIASNWFTAPDKRQSSIINRIIPMWTMDGKERCPVRDWGAFEGPL